MQMVDNTFWGQALVNTLIKHGISWQAKKKFLNTALLYKVSEWTPPKHKMEMQINTLKPVPFYNMGTACLFVTHYMNTINS